MCIRDREEEEEEMEIAKRPACDRIAMKRESLSVKAEEEESSEDDEADARESSAVRDKCKVKFIRKNMHLFSDSVRESRTTEKIV
eukprot:9494905-Karenia_brevis.AAC.1